MLKWPNFYILWPFRRSSCRLWSVAIRQLDFIAGFLGISTSMQKGMTPAERNILLFIVWKLLLVKTPTTAFIKNIATIMNSISLNELAILFRLVIEKLKKDEVYHSDFGMDEYWIIGADEWNDFMKLPEPGVGSLSEDVEYLKEAISEDAMYTYSDLDRVATILRAISEMQAPSTP